MVSVHLTEMFKLHDLVFAVLLSRCEQFDNTVHVHLRDISCSLAAGAMQFSRERVGRSMTDELLALLQDGLLVLLGT
jgi:hypothetical protein